MREALDGISPRYIQDKISNALVSDRGEGCVNIRHAPRGLALRVERRERDDDGAIHPDRREVDVRGDGRSGGGEVQLEADSRALDLDLHRALTAEGVRRNFVCTAQPRP